MNKKHVFAICTYKESPYLEECIKSIMNQSLKTKVIICTSTPNKFVETLANKYKIAYYINDESKGIGSDWNFAYNIADGEYVTIAHQDDIYFENYALEIINAVNKSKQPVIIYSEYKEIRNESFVENNTILKVKRLMNYPMRFKFISKSSFIKKRILALGNPICCPAVTLNKAVIGESPFNTTMKNSLDWEAWLRFSTIRGEFVYLKEDLMAHRISELSETTQSISSGVRYKEDDEIFRKYWPNFIAKILIKFYSKSMESNSL